MSPVNVQLSKHLLRRLGIIDGFWWRLAPRRNGSQPDLAQCDRQRPPLGEVLLHVDVLPPEPLTRLPHALDDAPDDPLVDKVVEPHLVRVLELKLVVVRQKPEKHKRRRYPWCWGRYL